MQAVWDILMVQIIHIFAILARKGGVAQVIVPAELGYPQSGDPDHSIVGPK